jgi:hypothetical protein
MMPMTEVYVVQAGCKYEGGGVRGIYSNITAAATKAKELMDIVTKRWQEEYLDENTGLPHHPDWGIWEADVSNQDSTRVWAWTESSEFVSIHLMPVQEFAVKESIER